ncbi:MAG: hypothetical protein LC689_03480 [Myxococcales bacterium]|nr:hypothetical protein [Myxococcales bacterium]
MAGRLTRFLNLERPRKPGDTPPHGVANEERFRARREEQLRSGVEIDATDATEQPFLRCPVCEADNTRFAVKCVNCQARLDSDEVRTWNVRFWQARLVVRSQEAKRPAVDVVEQNRLLGESIAREVADHERLKMGWSASSYDSRPLGMRLLEMIPDANVRFGVAMAMVATFFGAGTLAYLARSHPVLQTAGIVVAVGLLVLFTPNRSGRWRRSFWDD